jgi:SAM-dependent methyltransferase
VNGEVPATGGSRDRGGPVIETAAPIGTAAYFEEIHRADPDPFGLFDRSYEQRKRKLALSLLGQPRYQRAFEPGCSAGAVTLELAERCDRVVAMDLAAAAVELASFNCATGGLSNVEVRSGTIPGEWPDGEFDLVVFGEIGYYLSPGDLAESAQRAAACLVGPAHLLAVHWRPPIDNCALTGDEVHCVLLETPGLAPIGRYEEECFLAELFGAGPCASLPSP